MNLNIDKNSPEAAYEQIRRQVTDLVVNGILAAGTKLPSVRELARSLGVSVKTVRRAYDELAADNIIETRHGSGTFVTEHPEVATGTNLRTREEMGGPLAELPPMRWEPFGFNSEFFQLPHSGLHQSKLIHLHQASPDPSLFPFERIKQIATNMLWYPKEFFFDRGNVQGYQPLVEYLEREMALSGVPMAEGENDIIITGGFQRALSLVLDMLVRNGQKVAIEAPAFTGILNLLLAKRIDYVAIPVDGNGMDTEYLAGVLAQGEVRAIITMPTYHNPTGVTMSPERREHLLRLAARHRVPIVEDDWGRLLRYEGEAPPPLKSLDPGGYVIHIGTFSKCFLPGLRIGWITSPAGLSLSMVRAKVGADAGDSYFLQVLLHEFIIKGHFAKHLRKTVKEYKKRRNAMCKALKNYLPKGCRFHVPKGGLTIWVELPKGLNSLPLLSLAREAGVNFLPASFCMPDRRDAPALRLSFSRSPEEEIDAGVKILGRVIAECIRDPRLLDKGAKSFEDLYK
ncbi:PLP-dependent aminotransferase family protein [bacterium]|nr:PLP-dependent aminotransferase family protein [bacterium]